MGYPPGRKAGIIDETFQKPSLVTQVSNPKYLGGRGDGQVQNWPWVIEFKDYLGNLVGPCLKIKTKQQEDWMCCSVIEYLLGLWEILCSVHSTAVDKKTKAKEQPKRKSFLESKLHV